MKLLILFLISFNAMSMIQVDVANNNGKTFKGKFETLELADNWILKHVKKETFGKNKEVEESDSYFSKCIREEFAEECTNKFFAPDDYTIVKSDISDQIQAEKDAEEARKSDIRQIKAALDQVNNSELPLWHKRLLKRLIKELKE